VLTVQKIEISVVFISTASTPSRPSPRTPKNVAY
jgi:hypothetical protein